MKRLLLLPFLAGLFFFYGCSESPEDTASVALSLELKGEMDEYYKYLSSEDKTVISETEFAKRYALPEEIQEIVNLIPEAQEIFNVKKFKATVSGNTAIVSYILTIPDTEKIGKEILSLEDIMLLVGHKMNSLTDLPEELRTKLLEYIQKNGVPTKDVPRQIDMVKEEEEWKVYLNLKGNIEAGTRPKGLLMNF